MKIKKNESSVDYINNLQLAAPVEMQAGNIPGPAGSAAAAVVAGSIVTFDSETPVQQRSDVIDSTLLAQLAANFAFNRVTEAEKWSAKYSEVLENLGWTVSSFSFQQREFSTKTVKIEKVTLDILSTFLPGAELAAIAYSICELKVMPPDAKPIMLFDIMSMGGKGGPFQMGCVSPVVDGNVQLSVGNFFFSASQQHERFLFVPFPGKGLFFSSLTSSMILNEVAYAGIRQTVIDKLGTRLNEDAAMIWSDIQ